MATAGNSWQQRDDSKGITEGAMIEKGGNSACLYIPDLQGMKVLKKCYEKFARDSRGQGLLQDQ